MKIAVLGPQKTECGYTTNRIICEAKEAFKKVELVPIIDVSLRTDKNGIMALYEKKEMTKFDYIIPRIDSKRAQVGYPVMRFLDYLGVKKPYVAETILIAHNKFITLEQLAKNKIPIPDTYLTSSRKSANDVMGKVKLPAVIKLLSGFGGEGVIMVDSKEAFKSIVETMKILRQEMLIEKFIPNPGEDIRGILAGDEIIASFKRIAANGEKKANVHMGGKSMKFKLTPGMEEIVFKTGEAIKSKLCAVDMIVGKKGPVVIEANINFGIEGMEKATNINVARRIIEFVKDELKK